ncbi:MAG: alpha/beta hydrolase [Propionibacteriales bacterium]|nr:alpha/beta hydrolase [Propionibacteriales bacterium]
MSTDRQTLSLERHRDGQQWILDYLVQVTGREQNFELGGRRFPPEIKNYAMIPRVMFRHGRRKEDLAQRAEAAGHTESAVQIYYEAVEDYRLGQHAIYEDDNPEKIYIYQRMEACYDRIIELSPAPIQRVEITWEGNRLSGLLHLAPGDEPAPAVVYCPGMDRTKESFPRPGANPYYERGMHILAIDGPGQGASNLRKIRVTADNYEQATAGFLDHLAGRPDVDAERIGVSGGSMGSFWGSRLAAFDSRVSAVATAVACYGTKRAIFEQSSPRFKQIFMYMAGIHDEDEFDEIAAGMDLTEAASELHCPVLMVMGEYDPLCPLDEAYAVYERIPDPKEIWVVEDAFHSLRGLPHFGGLDVDTLLADWLRDVLCGLRTPSGSRQVVIKANDGEGPYASTVDGYWLPQRSC